MVNVNTSGGLVNCTNSTISQQGLNASVNILQLLTTEAELANGTNGINVTSDLNLTDPGLLNIGNVMLSTQVIEPAQVAYGPVGTTASDTEVQATLSMSLTLPILGTPLGTLTIPLSAATGVATLNTITCNDDVALQHGARQRHGRRQHGHDRQRDHAHAPWDSDDRGVLTGHRRVEPGSDVHGPGEPLRG